MICSDTQRKLKASAQSNQEKDAEINRLQDMFEKANQKAVGDEEKNALVTLQMTTEKNGDKTFRVMRS